MNSMLINNAAYYLCRLFGYEPIELYKPDASGEITIINMARFNKKTGELYKNFHLEINEKNVSSIKMGKFLIENLGTADLESYQLFNKFLRYGDFENALAEAMEITLNSFALVHRVSNLEKLKDKVVDRIDAEFAELEISYKNKDGEDVTYKLTNAIVDRDENGAFMNAEDYKLPANISSYIQDPSEDTVFYDIADLFASLEITAATIDNSFLGTINSMIEAHAKKMADLKGGNVEKYKENLKISNFMNEAPLTIDEEIYSIDDEEEYDEEYEEEYDEEKEEEFVFERRPPVS